METDVKPFWSNCAIEALKAHWRNPSNTNIICIDRGVRGIHFMWQELDTKKIYHFTHKRIEGKFSTLWFKGTVEEETLEGLKKWCKNNNVKFNLAET